MTGPHSSVEPPMDEVKKDVSTKFSPHFHLWDEVTHTQLTDR